MSGMLAYCCYTLHGAAQLPAWAPDVISVFESGFSLQQWPISDSQSAFAAVPLDSTWIAIGSRKQIGTYVASSVALGARLDLSESVQGFFGMGMRRKRWRVASIAPSNGPQAILGFQGRFPHSAWESRFVLEPAGFRSASQIQYEAAAQLVWIRSLPESTAAVAIAWFNGGFATAMSYRHQLTKELQAGFVMSYVSGFLGVQLGWNQGGLGCQLIVARSGRFPGTSFTFIVQKS